MKKVKPGDELNIPAATYNTFIDAAEDFKMRTSTLKAGRPRSVPAGQTIRIENNAGYDVDQFMTLGIDSSIFSLGDNLRKFADNFLLGCVSLTPQHDEKFVVAAEPIKAGAIGRAYAAGACLARVNIKDESHNYAQANTTWLTSAESGPVSILWKNGTSDIQLCLIRFNSVPPVQTFFPALVTGENNGLYSWNEVVMGSDGTFTPGGRSGASAREINDIVGLYSWATQNTPFYVMMYEFTADESKFYRFQQTFPVKGLPYYNAVYDVDGNPICGPIKLHN